MQDEPDTSKTIKVGERIHAEIKAEAARHGVKIPYLASVLLEDQLDRLKRGEFQLEPAASQRG